MSRLGSIAVLAALAFLGYAFWNSVKPAPAGIHLASLPLRLAESQVDFIGYRTTSAAALKEELDAVGRADQTIILDQCPLARDLADELLRRKRQHPNLKILLLTDPRGEAYGGSRELTLTALKRAGVIVVRPRLERMHDSNPLYGGLWRIAFGWWSEPTENAPGRAALTASLRQRNARADRRHVLVADDGAGGWTSIILSASPDGITAAGGVAAVRAGAVIRGQFARELALSELKIASWSTNDAGLPAAPPADSRGIGTIDARLLTEGSIQTALYDAISLTGSGDSIRILAKSFDDRTLVDAAAQAAARGVSLELLLDPRHTGNRAAAGELKQQGRDNLQVRWRTEPGVLESGFAIIRHHEDIWVEAGSADFTRRSLDDSFVEADVELRMPAGAGPARAAAAVFASQWTTGAAYATDADESSGTYWRYRLTEATGFALD